MIRHTVFFTFKADIDEARRRALLAEYPTFPAQFPSMKNFTLGRNISERDSTFEYAFSVDFEHEHELKDYLNSPQHEEHVVERFRPLIAARAIVSYEVEPGRITNLDL